MARSGILVSGSYREVAKGLGGPAGDCNDVTEDGREAPGYVCGSGRKIDEGYVLLGGGDWR